jgi:shikimate kinase
MPGLLVSWCVMGARAVFLVGYMASGKSTAGPELARRLGWEFIDLDSRIEARERKSVPEIFRDHGEPGFRLAESNALQHLAQSLERNSVVALGGGAFAQAKNRALLGDWPSVFLDAPLEELWQRSLADGVERPLRKTREQFARLYAERLPFYRQATITVETGGRDVASICTEIEAALHLQPAPEGGRQNSAASGSSNSQSGESQ